MAIVTYIIKTGSEEYYCNKSDNLPSTLRDHQKQRYPFWFQTKERKQFKDIIFFKGDHVKKIRIFGVKQFYGTVGTFRRYPFMESPS